MRGRHPFKPHGWYARARLEVPEPPTGLTLLLTLVTTQTVSGMDRHGWAARPPQTIAASLTWVLASGLKSLALWLGKRLSGRCRVTQMLAS